MDTAELQHHGILGMKWGVRRYQNEDGTLTAAGKKRYKDESAQSEDYKRAHSGKPMEEYSTKELQQIVNRLNLEKQYDKLTKEEVNKGKVSVDKILAGAGAIATATTTMLTLYNNADKIAGIIKKVAGKIKK